MSRANPVRGEASFTIAGQERVLRPTFAALVAAEQELGSLYALVERASEGRLRIDELTALFWYCLDPREGLERDQLGDAVIAMGLARCATPLRCLLGQILQGRA